MKPKIYKGQLITEIIHFDENGQAYYSPDSNYEYPDNHITLKEYFENEKAKND